MNHHTIICRLGKQDVPISAPLKHGSCVTEIQFVDNHQKLAFGINHAIEQLHQLGMAPSERHVDFSILAATVTAADTRISRDTESQDAWTREIDLHIPVAEPNIWNDLTPIIETTLSFLTGDHWKLFFHERPSSFSCLAGQPQQLRTENPSCVCLFSGGLDSFIGAIDLLSSGENPLFVSHYWDSITSKHQTYCSGKLSDRFSNVQLMHLRAHIGFPNGTVESSPSEDTLRGRSFLFFALATLAAGAIGGNVLVHVPENGLISLNVPLDPLRMGALSTRTTHPYYMARMNDILEGLDFSVRLHNPYRHQTKGQMILGCRDIEFLRREAKNTMSCSSPAKYRFAEDPNMRSPQHCGHCVPCIIRRASILEGLGIQDETAYYIADLHSRPLNTNKAEGRDIRSFLCALSRLIAKPYTARYDIHKPGPLIDYPDDLGAYEKVFTDGLREVGRLLQGVKTRPL